MKAAQTMPLPDLSVVQRATEGDRSAFEQLFRQLYPRVYRTVYTMLGNEPDAQEVTQDVWLKAWEKRSKYNFESSYTTWLHRIAVNTALDELRRRKRYWSRFKSILSPETANYKDNSPEPAKRMETAESAQNIHEAIAKLPEAQRTVLVLKEFEDYTYAEIADTVGCKIGTVMSRLHLARQKLQHLLNPASK